MAVVIKYQPDSSGVQFWHSAAYFCLSSCTRGAYASISARAIIYRLTGTAGPFQTDTWHTILCCYITFTVATYLIYTVKISAALWLHVSSYFSLQILPLDFMFCLSRCIYIVNEGLYETCLPHGTALWQPCLAALGYRRHSSNSS